MFSTLLSQFIASTAQSCSNSFFGLKTWFAYFPDKWFGGSGYGKCDINTSFQLLPRSGQSGLLLIALAIVDDLLRIAALIAVGYVIYGGIQYVTSQGEPDATAKARQTIINALIGVAVAVVASGIVSFVAKGLTS